MHTAIPAVNPTVMVIGMNLISEPNLNRPMKISISPAMSVAMTSPSMPFWATMLATMVAKAAVGPAICTRLPPRSDTINPATMAV